MHPLPCVHLCIAELSVFRTPVPTLLHTLMPTLMNIFIHTCTLSIAMAITLHAPGAYVPCGKARLEMRPDLNPSAALDGLTEFSHCWVIFVFHANTNAHKSSGMRLWVVSRCLQLTAAFVVAFLRISGRI